MALVSALAVGLGGAGGALARYAVGQAIEGRGRGTLVVNVLGSFAIGVLLAAGLSETALLAAAVGFCGAFTTFSSFAVETVRLAEDGEGVAAVANAAGTLLLALFAVLAGTLLGGLM
ncbi:CrcB family protein [Natronomonas halophila]|uniref:fluoride efflux transporter FluC n=1 Tax=Natronomonas halophila TaxID=2747817 RepID=UPI0015B613FA|nr:CrcB family protein [Natronomonas halophila]QLD86323.1 CrcB family protein [Natronomonas halophila]